MIVHSLKRAKRWLKSRHGHGVHSPFVYSFINDVIEESNLFYGYKDIADKIKLRRTNNSVSPNHSLKKNLFIFRISHYFNIKKTIAVGCDTATLVFYMQGGKSTTQSTLIVSPGKKANEAIALTHEEPNIRIIEASTEEVFTQFRRESGKAPNEPGLVYIDKSISTSAKQNILNECLNFLNEQTLIVVDGILSSKETRDFWKNVLKRNESFVCIDLIDVGIVIINAKLNKQHYKLFF